MRDLQFDERGLIPAIVQDAQNGQVLMMAYMNQDSLERTLWTGFTHFFSRSRNRFWKKGEESGHVQRVKEVLYDCDGDTLLVKVEQEVAACHTGHRSCFFRRFHPSSGKSRRWSPHYSTPVMSMERGNDMGPLDDCPFCRIGVEEGGPRSILYEDEQVLAFEDIRPQAPLHVLIIPRRHIRNLLDLEEGDAILDGSIGIGGKPDRQEKKVDRSGFRLVVNCNPHGGQTVDHLHLHLLAGRRMGWPPG